jgi:tRNA threonylcarbamoyladenosine biosynthesis protein TsaE
MKLELANEAATLALGAQIAAVCPDQLFTIHLEGELGAGKTTFTRGLLHALGHQGNVKSPTYTIVERYDLKNRSIFHFDLYRLADPEELEFLGLDDYLSDDSLCIIEWPSQGEGFLPDSDLHISLRYLNEGREALIESKSELGHSLLENLS